MKINYNELVDFSCEKITGDTSKIDEIIEYEEILFEISKAIINYRKENKLTQKELAKKMDVEQVMISKIESGNYNPTFKFLHKLSRTITGTADLFLEILQSIVSKFDNMYKASYNVTNSIIQQNKYLKAECRNIIYFQKYNINENKGGYDEIKDGTSSISIAG